MTYGEKIEALRAEILVLFNHVAAELGGDNGAELLLVQVRIGLAQAHASLSRCHLDQADYPETV